MESDMLNVEVYGGMMDHTWFDRPLGLAGTAALKGEDIFRPKLVTYDSERPVAIIPGIAIHMQRDAGNGWKIDRQRELMPVTGLSGAAWTEGSFVHFLAKELDVDDSEILSYDFNLTITMSRSWSASQKNWFQVRAWTIWLPSALCWKRWWRESAATG